MSGSVSISVWTAAILPVISALIGALIGYAGSYRSAKLQRRTGIETVAVMKENATAAKAAANAAEKSALVADRAADTADRAERHLNKFRLHDDTMRTLYWAADHAIAKESHRALLGLEVLGTLAEQSRKDTNDRAGRIVSATDEAVRKVAIPTFLAVLTTAANDETSGGGTLTASAVEINAARLLLAHAPNLSGELRLEIQRISEAIPGVSLSVETLYTGRHVGQENALSRKPELDLTPDRRLRPGRDGPTLSR